MRAFAAAEPPRARQGRSWEPEALGNFGRATSDRTGVHSSCLGWPRGVSTLRVCTIVNGKRRPGVEGVDTVARRQVVHDTLLLGAGSAMATVPSSRLGADALGAAIPEGLMDPAAMYEEEFAKATKKQKKLPALAYMKKFEKSFGAGGAAAAAGEDSDDDLEVEAGPGGDEDKQYKCPISGFFEWLDNPVRPVGCNSNRACVFSKKNMEAHIKRGPNAGHQYARCPIQGCNAFIKSVSELQADREMVKLVKQAKRSAERREAAENEDDDAVDMTQG